MMPVVFEIPFLHRPIPGYGLMLMIGFLVAAMWAARRAARSGANPDAVLNCALISLFAGVIGARIMYVVHYWPNFAVHRTPGAIVWSILDISQGGLEHYGGFILATVCTLAWLRWREKVSIRWYLDIIAPSAALGLAFGRMGCFLNGCCWGGVCDLPWAVEFPYGSFAQRSQWEKKLPEAALPEELIYFVGGIGRPITRESIAAPPDRIERVEADAAALRTKIAELRTRLDTTTDLVEKGRLNAQLAKHRGELDALATKFPDIRGQMKKYGMSAAEIQALARPFHSLPVHPAQLYAVVNSLLLALFLNALYWRRTRDGQVICALALVEPGTRWLLEVIRDDNPTDTLGVFTVSQFLALVMVLVALWGFWRLHHMPPRSPRAQVWEEPSEPPPSKPHHKHAAPA